MSEWREYKLGEVCEIKYGKDHKKLADGKIPCYGSGGIMRYVEKPIFEDETVLIPRKGTLNNIFYVKTPFWSVDTIFWTKINKSIIVPLYLYYLIKEIDFESMNVGSAVPSLTTELLNAMGIRIISDINEQKAIAEVLSSLDEKNDFLNRQNKTLESLAETYFRQWFIEYAKEEWEEKGLDETAEFLNGLPLQKYPYKSGKYLKAIKIKELNNGFSNSSDLCNDQLPDKYIVNNGNIIFSWSGSLAIDYWKYGKGALNQHLFKVTPNDYPKWFCYQWINYYLTDFRGIATDKATTMGHIQRHHLSQAKVLVPKRHDLEQMNKIMDPITKKIISNNNQIQTLQKLRDALLPKLINGVFCK